MLSVESTIIDVAPADIPEVDPLPTRLDLQGSEGLSITIITAAGCLLTIGDTVTSVFRYDDATPKLPTGEVIAAGVQSERCNDCPPEIQIRCPAYMFLVSRGLRELPVLTEPEMVVNS